MIDRLMVDMDANLLAFLRAQVDSFIKWDLIQFFCRNPDTMDTAENIARYIGRSAENMREEMAELSSGEVLAERKLNGRTIYSLSREPQVRELLRRFAESCDDQQFRIKAIYHILRTMR
jgi:hypothetical protein